jgi:predicted component of type VI protein secretion system
MTKTLVERLEEQGRVGICGVPDDFEWVSYAQAAAEITRLASRIEELERALGELGDDLERRAEACDDLFRAATDGLSQYRLSAKVDTYKHAAELARTALSDKG